VIHVSNDIGKAGYGINDGQKNPMIARKHVNEKELRYKRNA